jgi:hypothetical protein
MLSRCAPRRRGSQEGNVTTDSSSQLPRDRESGVVLPFERPVRGHAPEVSALGPEPLLDARRSALVFARRLLGSASEAEDVVQRAFELSMTTRRWSSESGTSLASHERAAVVPARIRAAEDMHARDVLGGSPAPEAILVDDEEARRRHLDAERALETLYEAFRLTRRQLKHLGADSSDDSSGDESWKS